MQLRMSAYRLILQSTLVYMRAVDYLTAERAQLLQSVFELCPNLILLDPKIGQGLLKYI